MADVSISLGQLLNHLIQSAYHDLSLLSELLPTKQDTERKIKLAQFAKKTNFQFIRFLAIANWASSRDISESFETFSSNLDEQLNLNIDTANFLCFQQTQELGHCGIPRYCLVSAIDILRTCNFTFLPTCITKRLISLPPLSQSEKHDTRDKLDQNLRLRLINLVPTLPQSLTPHLKLSPRGCLRMHIPYEFSAKFTLMMNYPGTPWRLVYLKFLVRDEQSVEDRTLIHFQKIFYIVRELVQTYLNNKDSENVLSDAYHLIHSFGQSLQLHVLYLQLIQLTQHWGRHCFRVGEYIPGEKLRIAYWFNTYYLQTSATHCSISVSASQTQPYLIYFHSESHSATDLNTSSGQSSEQRSQETPLNSENLIVDKVIHSCIENKCLRALQSIQKRLQEKKWPFQVLLRESPPSLILCLGFSDIPNKLGILKDPRNGKLQCVINDFNVSSNSSLGSLSSNKARSSNVQIQLDDLARALFDNVNHSAEFLTQFRAQFRLWHYEQQAIEMDMCVSSKLPIINEDALPTASLFKEKDGRILSFYSRLFIQLQTSHIYLIISVTASSLGQLVESFYLIETRPVSFSFLKNPIPVVSKTKLYSAHLDKSQYSFLAVSDVLLMAPEYRISIDSGSTNYFSIEPLQRRRLQTFGARFYYYSGGNRIKSKHFFELLHQIDSRVSLFYLQAEFNHVGCNDHYLVSSNNFSNSLMLIRPPCPKFVSTSVYAHFCDHLLFCLFNPISNKLWTVQIAFSSSLYCSTRSQINLNYNTSYYGKTLCQKFCKDWDAILVLFRSLVEYTVYLESCELLQKSSKILHYSYTRLFLSFSSNDPDFFQESMLDIAWNSRVNGFQLIFTNSPYAFAQSSFEELFNTNYSIPQLLYGLINLFPLYKLLEQLIFSTRMCKVGSSPAIIRLAFKIAIEIEYCSFDKIILHIHRQEPVERVLVLLERFIDTFEKGNSLDPPPPQIPTVSQSISMSKNSPEFNRKQFRSASRSPAQFSQSRLAPSKTSSRFPTQSAAPLKSTQYFFPSNDSENTFTPAPQSTLTIDYHTLKLLLLPSKRKPHFPTLYTFIGAVYLLDYERLVKFGNLHNLDPSRIKLEVDSFSVQFDKITVSVFLDPNFTDLGIKLSLNDTIDTHTILRDQDIQALVTFFHSSKIKSPVFSINALSCYLKLMSYSTNLIKTAAYIFRHSRNPPSEWLWLPELCLTIPDNPLYKPTNEIPITPGASCLFNTNRGYTLYLRLSSQNQEHNIIVDLILVYDYKQNIIDFKTYGISIPHSSDSIGNSIRKILSRVNASKETDCSLMLAVKEISKHLVI